jgi:hypothetical protein
VTNILKLRGKEIIFFLFLFSTFLYSNSNIPDSLLNSISNSHKWKAILHIRDNKPKINNKTFLLSFNNFSLKNELIQTIESFQNGENICRFPARYYLLKNLLKENSFKEQKCLNFDTYMAKTNTKDLDLVFAAENIASPSSMMGHVFFKLNSKENNNITKKNAVSFFTVIDTYNIPLLITKSTITGMKGFFILNPYEEQIYKYLFEENRSIWEYKLDLNDEDKKLILYHFWELKDIEMTYFFTGFNCATMIDDILSLTQKNYQENALWITPKDVIKNAKRNKIIDSVKMIPSLEWELSMLSENINSEKINKIIKIFDTKDFDDFKFFKFSKNKKDKSLEKYFILTYSKYLYLNKDILTSKEVKRIRKVFNENINVIDIKDYKNPINTFNDSQASLFFGKEDNKKFIGLKFLAASNTLYDDNREYFSENSLKIGEVNLKIDSEKIHLDSLDIYNMKLLIPWNDITRTFSKEFKVNYEGHRKKNLDRLNVLNISGGIGITNKIHDDIYLFNLAKVGMASNLENAYPYSSFETGVIIYELFDMKTVLSHEFIYNQNSSNNTYSDIILNQSIFFDNKDYKLDLFFNKKINDSFSHKTVSFNLNYFF